MQKVERLVLKTLTGTFTNRLGTIGSTLCSVDSGLETAAPYVCN